MIPLCKKSAREVVSLLRNQENTPLIGNLETMHLTFRFNANGKKMDLYEEMVASTRIGYLASMDNTQPRVRPMTFVLVSGGKLWSSTYDISGKMQEFLQNENVEVCFMDSKYRQLRVEGKIDTSGDIEKKRQLLELNPSVRNHFADEDDQHYVHLEILPTRVRWKRAGFSEYEEIVIEP